MKYTLSETLWYCHTHEQVATHVLHRDGIAETHVCDPHAAGTTAVCDCEPLPMKFKSEPETKTITT